MNVHPQLTSHLKFKLFRQAVGAAALEYLINIWGHCQDRCRGENWGKVSATYVEMAAGWTGEPGLLWEALTAPYNEKEGWIHERNGEVIITGWNAENRALIHAWCGSPQATVLKTRFKTFLELYPKRGLKPEQETPPLGGLETPRTDPPIRSDQIRSGVHTPTPAGSNASRPTPTLEEATAFVAENEPPAFDENLRRLWPVADDVKSAFLSLEANKREDGFWAWGKHRATDWRAALLSRMTDDKGKHGNTNRRGDERGGKRDPRQHEEREINAPIR